MSDEATAVVVTAAVALIGYVVKYLNDVRLAVRRDRLERVNRQLSELYGPLLALDAAGRRIWEEFGKRYPKEKGHHFWDPDPPRTPDDAAVWRLWMTTVFMPLHRPMREIVVGHADLLREAAEMPKCLVDLCANVAGYEVVEKGWRTGDFEPLDKDGNVSVVRYPTQDLRSYLEQAYKDLKEEQAKRLGRRRLVQLRLGRLSPLPGNPAGGRSPT